MTWSQNAVIEMNKLSSCNTMKDIQSLKHILKCGLNNNYARLSKSNIERAKQIVVINTNI